MTALHFVSYAAALAAFLFVTLSLASGLLYLAEIIEERSQSAKRIGKQAIYCIIGAHILFMVFDGLPFQQTAFGIACHVVYLFNFSKSWPFISLTSPAFMASCGLVVADHFAWFWYFSERAHDPKHGFGRHNQPYRPAWDDGRHRGGFGDDLTFMDVATFFGLCVWFVPFFLFLSLSANDNILPSLGDSSPISTPTGSPVPSSPSGLANSRSLPNLSLSGLSSNPKFQGHRSSILKSVLEPFLSALPSVRRSKRTSSRPNEGLIASPALSGPPSPSFSTGAAWGTPSQGYFPSPDPNAQAPSVFTPPSSPPTVSAAGGRTSGPLQHHASGNNLRGRASPGPSGSGNAAKPSPRRAATYTSGGTPPMAAAPGSPQLPGTPPPARKLTFGQDAPRSDLPPPPILGSPRVASPLGKTAFGASEDSSPDPSGSPVHPTSFAPASNGSVNGLGFPASPSLGPPARQGGV